VGNDRDPRIAPLVLATVLAGAVDWVIVTAIPESTVFIRANTHER